MGQLVNEPIDQWTNAGSIMFKRFFISVIASLLLASSASAVRLEYKVKKGDTFKLRMTGLGEGQMEVAQNGQIQNMAMEIAMDVTTTDKITAVDDKGAFDSDIEYEMRSLTVKVNGQEFPVPASPKFTPKIKRDKYGRVLETKGLEPLPTGGNVDVSKLTSTAAPLFPDKDLNVGEAWTIKAAEGSPVPMDISGKLLALEKVNGKDCAKVEMKMTADMAKVGDIVPEVNGMKLKMSGTVTTTMTFYVALDSGWVVKGDGNVETDLTIEIENFGKILQN